ncbi:flagellar motor switch protein FliM [Nocardioides sp. zg-1228]|uniref:flagellar motor switch protein FliM n=1 Tax=Nocardioides sp. zg-1228 TaxID=2763008 RepID=UPI00164269E4|nr:flagellar motor switch protein FliM [Nocardioides sp. zg-1228]MBC2932338.1 flagellar motor switch protein FliM [Nocardioides sp. zg-1228]QSF57854.1 flagellar motor switch protein FliM [Nocardioides sp. zg-1228]
MTSPPPRDDLRPTVHSGARSRRRARGGATPTAYDFRRPVQLSREHARLLQVCLDRFARQMATVVTSALRTVCTAQLLDVSERTYDEHVATLDELTYAVTMSAEPLPGHALLDVPLSFVMSAIDHMLGGAGAGVQPRRPLTELESAVVHDLAVRLLDELSRSLAGIVATTPALVGVEYDPRMVQAAAPGETVVVAAFELLVGDRRHPVTLCLPLVGLHPHLVRAAAPAPVTEKQRQQRSRAAELVDRRFRDVPVDAVVRFRTSHLPPDALATLAVGDVVRLGHGATDPLDVVVGETTFAQATAGTHGARLAALVVGTTKENA